MGMEIGMISIDTRDPRRLAGFWTRALGTEVEQDWGGEFVVLAPAHEGGPRLGLQKVDDPTPGKNRVHFDAHVADLDAEVERLEALGATLVDRQTVPGLTWQVLADPDGNQFCVGQPG